MIDGQIEVQAQADHIDSITRSKPINALAELIWNALDADASEVEIDIAVNGLGGIEEIAITDNGDGLKFDDAKEAFGFLGGSWKKFSGKTKREKRVLHGKEGKGRFKAFALGDSVTWDTSYRVDGGVYRYVIKGDRFNLRSFKIDHEPQRVDERSGTIVKISNPAENLGAISPDGSAAIKLCEVFAIYLRDYPTVSIKFAGQKIDPSSIQKEFKEYPLEDIEVEPGLKISAVLQIIEWNTKQERKICLCNKEGFTLSEVEPGIRPGNEFNFTAYLRSTYISDLHKQNRLDLGDLYPGLKVLLESARDKMRMYFREKKSAQTADLVKEWKEEGIYPYAGEAIDPIDRARRQVFEICAFNVHEYLDDFRRAGTTSRKFTFRMLSEALEENPVALQKIILEVLGLPREKREELAELLQYTTLSAIIETSKLVTDRLTIVKGMEELLFDKQSKKELECDFSRAFRHLFFTTIPPGPAL